MSDINVGSVAPVQNGYQTSAVNGGTTIPEHKESEIKNDAASSAEQAGAVYEKSTGTEKKATYSINKMSAEDRE